MINEFILGFLFASLACGACYLFIFAIIYGSVALAGLGFVFFSEKLRARASNDIAAIQPGPRYKYPYRIYCIFKEIGMENLPII